MHSRHRGPNRCEENKEEMHEKGTNKMWVFIVFNTFQCFSVLTFCSIANSFQVPKKAELEDNEDKEKKPIKKKDKKNESTVKTREESCKCTGDVSPLLRPFPALPSSYPKIGNNLTLALLTFQIYKWHTVHTVFSSNSVWFCGGVQH